MSMVSRYAFPHTRGFIFLVMLVSLELIVSPDAQAADSITLSFLKFDTNPAWEQAAASFAEQDNDVNQVILLDVQDNFESFDCSLSDQFHEWQRQYADLTAQIQADPFFDEADLFPGAWESVTSDGVTLGYPLALIPDVIRFDVDWLNRLGVPLPDNNWTTGDFIQTLKLLKKDVNAPAPFGMRILPMSVDIFTHLFMAGSGLLVDSRTDPPTLNFNQPSMLETVRQILDLAREGLINFPENNVYSGQSAYFDAANYPIWSDSIDSGIWSPSPDAPQRNLRTVAYPRGTAFAPISYRVNAGYVHEGSQNVDACYRWFSYLATRPDVIGIPARLSQAQQYAALSGEGDSFLAFYDAIRQRANDPASRIPQHNYPTGPLPNINVRLDRAYREYVFDGLPLETVLSNAQQDTETYVTFMSVVPSDEEIRKMSQGDMLRYDGMVEDCRRAYVPEIMWMYGG